MYIIASVLQIDKFAMVLCFRLFSVHVYLHMLMFMYVLPHASSAYVYSKACVWIRIHVFDCIKEMWNTPNILMLPTYCLGHFIHFTSKGVFVIYWLYRYRSFWDYFYKWRIMIKCFIPHYTRHDMWLLNHSGIKFTQVSKGVTKEH